MLSPLKPALIAAIPLELINFFVVGYPADPRPISTASQYPAVALQWYVFHLPGIVASDRSIYLREHGRLDSAVLFLAGFVCTAIFLTLILWLFKLAANALRKLSSPLRHAH
ncbi:MAG TPA: hypothetical protein VGI45_23340 [Terracidiphilus sp.]|jgi:hypothetical protein